MFASIDLVRHPEALGAADPRRMTGTARSTSDRAPWCHGRARHPSRAASRPPQDDE